MTTITTLIPAYKPDYLGEVFLGLRRQSLRDFRVIVSDDSRGGVITEMLRQGRFGPLAQELNVTVVRGPGNARRNHEQLIDLWAGQSPLVHLMLDDDLVYPDFYRAHVDGHASGDFAATISQRWLSQNDAGPAWSLPLPALVQQSPLRAVRVDSQSLITTTLPTCENWLGELSNMVFSAQGISHYPRPPADDLSWYGLLDIGALLAAAQKQDLLFLRDHLGVFRQHGQQTTHTVHAHGHKVAMLVWATYALKAWHEQRITAQQAIQAITITVTRCMQQYGQDDAVMNLFFDIVQHQGHSLAQLHETYRAFWLDLLSQHPGTCAAATTTAPAPVAAPMVPPAQVKPEPALAL
jgi:hypothetical protein